MNIRRFTISDMSDAIEGVMLLTWAGDKSKHDIMRMIEHVWNGRGTAGLN